jgi:hypothetical protein
MGEYVNSDFAVMDIPRGQLEIYWIAQSIHNRMDLCGLPASAHSDLRIRPLFPLEAC